MQKIKDLEKTIDNYGRYVESLLERLDEETTKRKDAEAYRAYKVEELVAYIAELERQRDENRNRVDYLLGELTAIHRLASGEIKSHTAETETELRQELVDSSLQRLDNLTALAKKRGVGGYAKPEKDCGPLTEEDRELLGLDARCAKEQI
jgi:chromosome segregation ATPase